MIPLLSDIRPETPPSATTCVAARAGATTTTTNAGSLVLAGEAVDADADADVEVFEAEVAAEERTRPTQLKNDRIFSAGAAAQGEVVRPWCLPRPHLLGALRRAPSLDSIAL